MPAYLAIPAADITGGLPDTLDNAVLSTAATITGLGPVPTVIFALSTPSQSFTPLAALFQDTAPALAALTTPQPPQAAYTPGSYTGGTITGVAALVDGAVQAMNAAMPAGATVQIRETVTPDAGGATLVFTSNTVTVGAAAATLTMTQLDDMRVYQRSTTTGGAEGRGSGVIAIAVDLSGTATQVDYRVRQSSDGTIIRDWTQAATNLPAGAQTVTLPDVPATAQRVHIDLRADGGPAVLGTARVAVGRVIAVMGQSLAVRLFGKMDGQTTTLTDLGLSVSDRVSVFATYEDGQRTVGTAAWQLPSDDGDYDSAFAARFLDAQVGLSGVCCALIGHSRGAQRLSAFISGGVEYAQLAANLTEVGGFETAILLQGHSDSAAGTAPATYRAQLDTLLADLAANNAARGAGFDLLVSTIPNTTSGAWGDAVALNSIRKAADDWATANPEHQHIAPADIRLIDGIHQSQAGSVDYARHLTRASRPGLGLAGDHRGPTITAATRSTNKLDILLDVALPAGATALNLIGDPSTRFKVYPAGTTSGALALDATTPISISGSQITLKLAADPGDEAALDVWAFRAPDNANDGGARMVYDDDTSGGFAVGRHLAVSLVPSVADALGVAEPSAGPLGDDLTLVGATFEASETGFGQRLNGGYGYAAPSEGLPASDVWTVELRYVTDAAPSGIKVIWGHDQKAWFGINSAGRLVANIRNTANTEYYFGDSRPNTAGTNPIIADGAVHHIALQSSPGGTALFLDGVEIFTGPPGKTAAAGGTLGVKDFGQNRGFTAPGAIEECAIWDIARYTDGYTVPTAPHSGTEPGLRRLWHLDGDGASA